MSFFFAILIDIFGNGNNIFRHKVYEVIVLFVIFLVNYIIY